LGVRLSACEERGKVDARIWARHAERVVALLQAASDEAGRGGSAIYFPCESLGLELIVIGPEPPPSDATNYLGGVGDVLEDKRHRGDLPHLGELAGFALYWQRSTTP
jgi:hypothetical protein